MLIRKVDLVYFVMSEICKNDTLINFGGQSIECKFET